MERIEEGEKIFQSHNLSHGNQVEMTHPNVVDHEKEKDIGQVQLKDEGTSIQEKNLSTHFEEEQQMETEEQHNVEVTQKEQIQIEKEDSLIFSNSDIQKVNIGLSKDLSIFVQEQEEKRKENSPNNLQEQREVLLKVEASNPISIQQGIQEIHENINELQEASNSTKEYVIQEILLFQEQFITSMNLSQRLEIENINLVEEINAYYLNIEETTRNIRHLDPQIEIDYQRKVQDILKML